MVTDDLMAIKIALAACQYLEFGATINAHLQTRVYIFILRLACNLRIGMVTYASVNNVKEAYLWELALRQGSC